jgi:phosphoribosylaminoimidazole-succinocarboxamide synthase
MPYLPPNVAETALSEELKHCGLNRIHQGKVRDTYEIPGHPMLLLVVATDRISIFDFVLGALVMGKGEVLTALVVYFLTQVLSMHEHHLVAYGSSIDQYLPASIRRYRQLQVRALVVKRANMMPVECVVRGILTGSAYEKYAAGSRVLWGYTLPDGLHDGSWLDQPMFTPTDRGERTGHDEPMSRDYVHKTYGPGVEVFSIHLFEQIRKHARERGIIFADTKFEFDTTLMICDEIATPDSSRYLDADEYEEARRQRKMAEGYDKQPVRNWGLAASTAEGETVNIKKLKKTEENAIVVGNIPVPPAVLTACTERYFTITGRLAGKGLEQFQKKDMGIAA